MVQFILWSLFCFILGAISFRLYQSRLIRYLPEQSPLKIRIFFGEFFDSQNPTVNLTSEGLPDNIKIIVSIENLGTESVHFESWAIRSLNAQGYLRQLFSFPQNFVQTLSPNEKMNLEISELNFLTKGQLYTIVLRDIYGREWTIEQEEMQKLRKDLFWQSL